jgi:hypothetical protein
MKSSYDIIVWIFIFLLIALIIGLYISENKRIPQSLYMRTKGASTPYIEHFKQNNSNIDGYRNSSSFDVTGGASSKYGWGINENDYERNHLEEVKKEEKKKCVQKKNDPICTKDNIQEKDKESCNKCDILQHPDINKYVLKSSVPACPKIDVNDYIKKSEIPACPKIDLNEYIKKSEVPAQKVCPTIEKCPTCPTIPDELKNKKEIQNNYQFNILDVKNLSNEDLKLLLKDERIKNYLDSEYEEKNNIPKPNVTVSQTLFESNIPVKSEEMIQYTPTSSLWDEIKSLFGISTNKKTNNKNTLSEEETKKVVKSEEKKNKNNLEEEEEHKMIYNKECKDNNFFKQDESNAMGMYAGDSLYASF